MRILGRIEKALLALVAAFVFMGVASTAAPGLQTIVAGVACPAGTTSSAVVRYPHVEEPAEMVRNTPLVCVTDAGAVLASHWRVLPALFGVGLIGASAGVVVVSVAAAVVRRGRDGGTPPRPRRTFEGVRYLPLLIATPFVFTTAFGLYWWLAVDTPYRVSACESSDGGNATCYDGEPVYRMLSLVFGAIALVSLTVWVVAVVRSLLRTQRFDRAWSAGRRATATLIGAEATNTSVNDRTVHRFLYEVRPPDGSAPFTFEEKGVTSPAGTIGGVVEVVYDPTDPGAAFIVPPGSPARRHDAIDDGSDPQRPVITW
jgi:hypothetical protein